MTTVNNTVKNAAESAEATAEQGAEKARESLARAGQSLDNMIADIENRGFFQRHKRKIKWTAYGIGAAVVVGGAYVAYKRYGGTDAELVEAVTDAATPSS